MSTHTVERLQREQSKPREVEWHPLAEKFGLLEGEEWEAFKESIRKSKGPRQKIVCRKMPDGSWQGLDGRNRYIACKQLQIYPPIEFRDFASEAEVQAFIIDMNVKRRHLTTALRRELVGDLREQGQTVREIAETLGIPKSTVGDDLKAAPPKNTENNGPAVRNRSTPPKKHEEKQVDDPPKDYVIGKDGRKYKKHKAQKVREPGDDFEAEGEPGNNKNVQFANRLATSIGKRLDEMHKVLSIADKDLTGAKGKFDSAFETFLRLALCPEREAPTPIKKKCRDCQMPILLGRSASTNKWMTVEETTKGGKFDIIEKRITAVDGGPYAAHHPRCFGKKK